MKKKPGFNELLLNEELQLGFLALLSLTIFFTKLGMNGLASLDDCFYAEEAKEMLKTGNWLILHYNGAATYHHAPLFMWLVALSYKVFGVTVYAAKFPSALLGFLTVFLVHYIGKRILDATQGFLAAFILATTYPFFQYARHAMLEVPLAFFVTLAFLALILALGKNSKFFWLWGASIGFAILTKSVFGVFPLFITLVFLVLAGRWKVFVDRHFWGGVATTLVMAGAWVASQYLVGGQDFINDHLKFVIMGKTSDDNPDAWYAHLGFVKDLFVFYWPWIPIALYGLLRLVRGDLKDRETTFLLLLWSLTVLVVMSFMKTQYIWYLMQSLPALALVTAFGIYRWVSEPSHKEKLFVAIFIIGALVIVVLNFLPRSFDADNEPDTRTLAPYVKYMGDKGAKVIVLREDFYGLNNALLFFSDYAAQPIYPAVADVQKEFAATTPVICVAHRKDLEEIGKTLTVWYPVKYADDLVLISNQKWDVADVPRSGIWQN